MNMKNYLLIACIIAQPLSTLADYPAEQGYQVSSQKTTHYPAQQGYQVFDPITQKARELDIKRLEELDQEEKDAYSHTNLAWAGVVTGVALMTAGTIVNKHNFKLLGSGLILASASGEAGYIAQQNESKRAESRRNEREVIHARLRQ